MHIWTIRSIYAACTPPKIHILCWWQTNYLPIKEGWEDEDTQDAKGQDVEDVGQEHLPFTVQTILTLLITDGSQCWDYWKKQTDKVISRTTEYADTTWNTQIFLIFPIGNKIPLSCVQILRWISLPESPSLCHLLLQYLHKITDACYNIS